MAKKRRQQSGRGRAKQTAALKQSPEAREQEAKAALAAERWRDAIQGYKALLKEDAGSSCIAERRQALAAAYAGRARELTAKGMLKEAAVIWENRAALGPEIPPTVEHGMLRLRLGDAEPLLAAWAHPECLSPAERQQVGEQLAAQALSRVLDADPAWLDQLPSDDPIRRYAEPAAVAVRAYCDGDETALEAALGALPFRSPYRALALLLKALARASAEPEAAREMLGRIGDTSAFAPLRQVAELALLPEAELLSRLGQLDAQQTQLIAAVRGWSKQQLGLAQALAALNSAAPDQQALLHILKRHRDLLGADWVKRASLRLVPRLVAPFTRPPASWSTLSKLERALIETWAAEARSDPWAMIDACDIAAQSLIAEQPSKAAGHRGSKQATAPRASDRALEIATILRRADSHFDLLETPHPEDYSDSPETLAAVQLERSLHYDPEHRETYLRLMTWYRRVRRLKDARRVLADATQRWPQDMAVLEAAMEIALASKAFKKAAGIASQMLKIDPINSSARQRLVDSHVQHAVKQVGKFRGDLARKELSAARSWTERGAGLEGLRHRLDLLDALVLLALVDVTEGQALVSDLLARRGHGAAAQVELMLAADTLSLKQREIAELLGIKRQKVSESDELMLIIGHLRTYLEHRDVFRPDLKGELEKLLKGAPWKQLELRELELACETLRSFRLHPLRRDAARAGLRRWPKTPMLEYHEFESRFVDRGFPSPSELDRLEDAMDRAEAAGDSRAAQRLRELLQDYRPFGRMPPRFEAPWGDPFGDDWDDGPQGQPGGSPAAPSPASALSVDDVLDMLDSLPLKEVLQLTDLPKPLAKKLLRLAKDEGEDLVREMLKASINEDRDELREPPIPAPKPKGSGRRPPSDDTDDPAESPQLNLF